VKAALLSQHFTQQSQLLCVWGGGNNTKPANHRENSPENCHTPHLARNFVFYPPANRTRMADLSTASSDLLWQIVRDQSSYIVKRTVGGNTVILSRDPLNLRNVHSRKHTGTINDKAIGIYAGEKDSVTLLTKKTNEKFSNKPVSMINKTVFKGNKPARKVAVSVVSTTAKQLYRLDLRKDAVARVSAIKKSQRPVKPDRPVKLRGAKAKKAAAAAAAAASKKE